jgi:hypothetical protein
VAGGRVALEVAEQFKIDSVGGVDKTLNVGNPIGANQIGLMPEDYIRP